MNQTVFRLPWPRCQSRGFYLEERSLPLGTILLVWSLDFFLHELLEFRPFFR